MAGRKKLPEDKRRKARSVTLPPMDWIELDAEVRAKNASKHPKDRKFYRSDIIGWLIDVVLRNER